MSKFDTDADESTDLEPRDARALTEYTSVLPEGGDIYTVVGQNGGTYTVDAREGRCTCPDAEYNLAADEQCKHERRVAFATGATPVPTWVNRDAVNEQLGEHVATTPRVAATDGGRVEPPGRSIMNAPLVGPVDKNDTSGSGLENRTGARPRPRTEMRLNSDTSDGPVSPASVQARHLSVSVVSLSDPTRHDANHETR